MLLTGRAEIHVRKVNVLALDIAGLFETGDDFDLVDIGIVKRDGDLFPIRGVVAGVDAFEFFLAVVDFDLDKSDTFDISLEITGKLHFALGLVIDALEHLAKPFALPIDFDSEGLAESFGFFVCIDDGSVMGFGRVDQLPLVSPSLAIDI